MSKTTFVIFLFCVVAVSGCDRMLMKEKRQEIDKINLRGLLDTLHLHVNQANPLLIKKAVINGKTDSSNMKLSEDEWKKEFENFADLKLRPGNLLSQFDENIEQTDSGYIYHYHSKDYKKEKLDSFLLGLNNKEEIQYLQAYLNDKNYFNSSAQNLRIDFTKKVDNHILPLAYYINGWQKIRTKDTISFEVYAQISY